MTKFDPLDFLSIEPTEVDTPDFIYQKFRFLFVDGHASIIARSGYPVRAVDGTLTMTGDHSWQLVTGEGTWTIERTRGCACTGQPIIPKTQTSA